MSEKLEITQADLDLAGWFKRRMEGDWSHGHVEWLLASHRSGDSVALRERIKALEEALERIETVDMGGGFLGAEACRKLASDALKGGA